MEMFFVVCILFCFKMHLLKSKKKVSSATLSHAKNADTVLQLKQEKEL